jgi:glycosyltransferase involved in cell wall biosynthesis
LIYADQRWIGKGGIGRFARHVLAGIEYRPISLPLDPASPADAWRLSKDLAGVTRNDLFFSPGYNSPLFCESPFVFTLHDLNHIDRPENSSASKRLYYATVLKRACRRAARIVTVSEFSRRRIVDWSGTPEDRVVNVGNGVDSAFHPGVAPYEVPFSYLLCVGNRKHHKNEFRTVESFARSGLSRSVRLVFTGAPSPELTECIRRHDVEQSIVFTGAVEEARLPSLYRSAVALVFASLYEGFGLPVLEAMACGTPVICANATALPEVAGDAALLINPNSADQISDAMKRVVTDDLLRRGLRDRGLEQASRFPWKTTVSKVRDLLAECQRPLSGSPLKVTI